MILTGIMGVVLLGQGTFPPLPNNIGPEEGAGQHSTPGARPRAVVLTGSRLTIERAREEATLIVVARSGEVGLIGLGSIKLIYELRLEISRTLKGEIPPGGLRHLSGNVDGSETVSTRGAEYIVFINDFKGHPNLVKILPKTDENLAALAKLDEAARKP